MVLQLLIKQMYESSKCEFSSFTVKSQQINIQLQVEGKRETPNIMRTLNTSMPLALSWRHLYDGHRYVIFWTRNHRTLSIISNCWLVRGSDGKEGKAKSDWHIYFRDLGRHIGWWWKLRDLDVGGTARKK